MSRGPITPCAGSGQPATAVERHRYGHSTVCPTCHARVLLYKRTNVIRAHTSGAPTSYANERRKEPRAVNVAPPRFAGPPVELRCETCCYWFLGRCRRYAPKPTWPRTHALHWCAEWRLPSAFAVVR